ncbi:hypothetical protein [Halomonas sp. JS92-SW72]|uniref:hypothetical protein n=1 Tax=Halomonas sp. JS92-SW72 TaxID=2306583 RepID=UPI000E5AA9BD|nr:hypothetical protein [Halomonas sp. JS92-SW72]AXY43921.1 hypothetical protein D1793_17955 [Halomonas sp. JS92-SW72]
MNRDDLPRLRPLADTHHAGAAALLVDEAAGPESLHQEASRRLSAVQALMFSATFAAESRELEGHDLAGFAQAAQILAADAMELVDALHLAHDRAAWCALRKVATRAQKETDHV